MQVLIKPAGAACNMQCTYCFYHAIADSRLKETATTMSKDTLKLLIKKTLAEAEHSCSFAFQGGEPTLAGLDFFEEVLTLQKMYNYKQLPIMNTIQTNGYLIDDNWAKFLAKNKFLVGLSLDGDSKIHNQYRLNHLGKGTFNRVMQAIDLFKKHKVEFNILAVITKQNARNINRSYSFFKKQNLRFLQFIPCLEPIDQARGSNQFALTEQDYSQFLINIFDLWAYDFMQDNYISIRHIDNMIRLCLGHAPEACSQRGHCSIQYIIEADGSVYPCDFYAYQQYKMGNINIDNYQGLAKSQVANGFIEPSKQIPAKCKACVYFRLCRNGCRRDREGQEQINYYCQAYQQYFAHIMPRLQPIVAKLAKMNGS